MTNTFNGVTAFKKAFILSSYIPNQITGLENISKK